MKKFTQIILTLSIAACLTACDNNKNPNNSSDNSTSDFSNNSTTDSLPTSNSSDSSDSISESQLSDEALALIKELKMQSFIGPDGETVLVTDAVDAYKVEIGKFFNSELSELVDTVLKFDFGYIRYARPYFYVDGQLNDFSEDLKKIKEEQQPIIDALPEIEWFKVEAGDKLNCGLTVKSAELVRYPVTDEWLVTQRIEFDGELTLEGTLFATTNPNDYFSDVGDLNFIPDATKVNGLPVISAYYDEGNDRIYTVTYSDDKISYVSSDVGGGWHIGNINDTGFDQQTVFGKHSVVKVKVTLKNIYAYTYDNGLISDQIYAEIKDIETV